MKIFNFFKRKQVEFNEVKQDRIEECVDKNNALDSLIYETLIHYNEDYNLDQKDLSEESNIKLVANTLYYYNKISSILSTAMQYVTDNICNIEFLSNDGITMKFTKPMVQDFILSGNMFFLYKKENKKIDFIDIKFTDVSLYYKNEDYTTVNYYYYKGNFYNIYGDFVKREPNSEFKHPTGYRLMLIRNKTIYNKHLGVSELLPIVTDLQVQIFGLLHNKSLLKNSGSSSGILTMSNFLPEQTILDIKNNFNKIHSGYSNAGKTLMLQGVENIEYKQLSKSNKDMDYGNLNESIITTILNKFKISPAMVGRSNHDTHNNSSVGFSNFWSFCCLPILKAFEIQFNENYYGLDKTFKMNAKTFPIESLKTMIDTLNLAVESNGITINEARKWFGLEELVGGDIIFSKTTGNPVAFKDSEKIPKDALLPNYIKAKGVDKK
jgi:HK97 family phage portal protein